MKQVTTGTNTIVQCLLGLMALAAGILYAFPDQYVVFNIAIVILLFFSFLLTRHGVLSLRDVLVAFLVLGLMAIQLDVTKISLFVAYLFWREGELYSKPLSKTYRNILLVCFLCVLVAYVMGFNQEFDRLNWSPSKQMYIKEKALGFHNPNKCMLVAFCISGITITLSEKIWQYILVALLNYLLFQYTNSRTFFYVIVLVVAVLILLKIFRCEKKISVLGKLIPVVYLSIFALSILLPYYGANTQLNALFTGRLANNKAFLQTGLTLFGNVALESATFDSSYLHMLLTKGIVFTALFSALLVSGCRKATISNKGAVILLAVFLAGFMEVIFLDCSILFLIGCGMHCTAGRANEG